MEQNSRKSSQPSEAIKKQIDENLRKAYDDTLKEELPDRFKDLLAQLKSGDTTPKDEGQG